MFYANSVDPDQTPRFAMSDLGLHCLSMSLLGTLGINGLIKWLSTRKTFLSCRICSKYWDRQTGLNNL